MKNLQLHKNPKVSEKFKSYPKDIQPKMEYLRSLIMETAKESEAFKYENNRAILFNMDDEVPKKELKVCIDMALHYHSVKHLPRLGK